MALPYMLKKIWWYVKPFRYNTGTWLTDGRTDRRTEFLYHCCAYAP